MSRFRNTMAVGKLRTNEIKTNLLRVGGNDLNEVGGIATIPSLANFRDYHGEFLDFGTLDDNWNIYTLEAGTGSATEALTNAVGGELILTNAAGDNDTDQVVRNNESFLFATTKPLWFEAKLKISDATQSDFMIGLIATENLTAVADTLPGDGCGFCKDDADTNIDTFSSQNGTNEENAAVGTVATAYIRYSFYYDGVSVKYYLDGEYVGNATTTINDDEPMAICFLMRNGEAAAKTMTIDYVHVVQAR